MLGRAMRRARSPQGHHDDDAAVPRWGRALLAAERAAAAAHSVGSATRLELLCSLLPPSARDAVTARVFARQATYLPGGTTFDEGLFDWERAALADPAFPARGRVLLGGAGGGRELRGLCELGYDVLALEPSERLSAGAAAVAARCAPGAARVERASYSALCAAVSARRGPLWGALAAAPLDAVVLGWGSLPHVTEATARVALWTALHALAPQAPVLLSHYAPGDFPERSRAERLATHLRRAMAGLGAPGAATPGLRFLPHAGFVAVLPTEALVAEAAVAGYDPLWIRARPYRHALLHAPR
jgi:hypothetical protein